jgi:hypothetical protein
VLNHSAIQGNFDFLINYSPDETANDEAVRLLSAIQETGLKLGLVGEICGSPIAPMAAGSLARAPANPIRDSAASAFCCS